MKIVSIAIAMCRRVVRLGSFALSLTSLWVFTWADFRSDTLPLMLFCALPLLSFPAMLLCGRRAGRAAMVQAALALGYLVVYSMLDWRTCQAFGYCQSVARTVVVTLTAWRVEGMFLIAAAALALVWLERREAVEKS